jgi:hypothetical protein
MTFKLKADDPSHRLYSLELKRSFTSRATEPYLQAANKIIP